MVQCVGLRFGWSRLEAWPDIIVLCPLPKHFTLTLPLSPSTQGEVSRKLIRANPGLKVNKLRVFVFLFFVLKKRSFIVRWSPGSSCFLRAHTQEYKCLPANCWDNLT